MGVCVVIVYDNGKNNQIHPVRKPLLYISCFPSIISCKFPDPETKEPSKASRAKSLPTLWCVTQNLVF